VAAIPKAGPPGAVAPAEVRMITHPLDAMRCDEKPRDAVRCHEMPRDAVRERALPLRAPAFGGGGADLAGEQDGDPQLRGCGVPDPGRRGEHEPPDGRPALRTGSRISYSVGSPRRSTSRSRSPLRTCRVRKSRNRLTPMAFVAGYLATWTGVGVVAYLVGSPVVGHRTCSGTRLAGS
jgi:hypothetical protein